MLLTEEYSKLVQITVFYTIYTTKLLVNYLLSSRKINWILQYYHKMHCWDQGELYPRSRKRHHKSNSIFLYNKYRIMNVKVIFRVCSTILNLLMSLWGIRGGTISWIKGGTFYLENKVVWCLKKWQRKTLKKKKWCED